MKTTNSPERIETLTRKGGTHRGIAYPAEILEGHHADVVKGESIRLFGTHANCYDGPRAFDITFKVGDSAEYDSYNLHYIGTITSITPKTVTIVGSRKCRLSLRDFSWRNWNFDLDTIEARNAEEMQCI